MIIADIKFDLQNFQIKRKKVGNKSNTIDQDLGKVKALISFAFENDLVSYLCSTLVRPKFTAF
jgi:hypothetical protein